MGATQTLLTQRGINISLYDQYFQVRDGIIDTFFPKGKNEDLPTLHDIVIPKMIEGYPVIHIQGNTFEYKEVTSVRLFSIVRVADYCFGKNPITSINLGIVSVIEEGAFIDCPITDIIIGDNVLIFSSGSMGSFGDGFYSLYQDESRHGGHYVYSEQSGSWIKLK